MRYIWPLFILAPLTVWAQDDDLNVFETTISEELKEASSSSRSKKWNPQTSPVTRDAQGRVLDLRSAIEEAMRKNPFETIRGYQKSKIDLRRSDIFQSFWLPNIALELQTSNHQIDRFRESSQNTPGMGAQQAPTGSLGLVIEDYTLFNWGRDYLEYQNNKQILNRQDQILLEQKRHLKFAVIAQYFRLLKTKEVLKIKREELRQASFIHKVAREKLKLKKVRAQEYYQTRSEYLRTQTDYQEASFVLGIDEEKISNLLGDEYRGSYRTNEQLKYIGLNATQEEALKLSQAQSPAYRDAKLAYDNATRSYEKTLKDNLPLPKFSLNLGTYRTGFDPEGSYWQYQTTPGNRNIELVAAIDMRWNLLGEGGFFNGRRNQEAFLNKQITETKFYNTRRELEVKVRTIFKTLRFLEQKVDISGFQQKNAQSNYDVVLDNYVSGVATYADIKLALDNLVDSSINSQEVKFDHLLRKLELADLMGLEDFPGENFESLAVK